jgi:uncharacterized protein (DUF2164 family)
MRIPLSRENRRDLVVSIKSYFAEHHDEEIGDLKAGFLLDFFLQALGPRVYNQAIRDAQSFMQDKLIDLEAECYKPEQPRKTRPH